MGSIQYYKFDQRYFVPFLKAYNFSANARPNVICPMESQTLYLEEETETVIASESTLTAGIFTG